MSHVACLIDVTLRLPTGEEKTARGVVAGYRDGKVVVEPSIKNNALRDLDILKSKKTLYEKWSKATVSYKLIKPIKGI